jgi:hypothetical protein
MAILNGDELSGLIGPIVIRRRKDGTAIVQSRAKSYTQSPKSKKNTKMFGYGSTVACYIRVQLSGSILFYDPPMINRFNNPVREVLKHCFNKKEKLFTLERDSFKRLADFEFNVKSPLVNFLWVKPEMVLEDNVLKVIIPEFKNGSQLIFPSGTNTCEVTITLTQININQALTSHELTNSFEINADQESYLAREIVFNVANGSLCVAAIGLTYYKRTDDIRVLYNSKLFSPANVIGALIVPGVYIQPPVPPTSNKGYSKEWVDAYKLKF